MVKDDFKTKVIFRTVKSGKFKGEVTAFFIDDKHDHYTNLIVCYASIGQHGAADYGYILNKTRLSTPTEYYALKIELEKLGYDLDIRTRMNNYRNL